MENDFFINKGNTPSIIEFVSQLYTSLINKEETFTIPVFKPLSLYFIHKFIDYNKVLDNILNHEVPIWVKKINYDEIKNFEKSIIQVIKYIDGISYVTKIAINSKISLNYVKYIIYNLYLKNYIAFVDIFDCENIYRANKKLKEMFTSKINLTQEFEEYCFVNSQFQKSKVFSSKNEVRVLYNY